MPRTQERRIPAGRPVARVTPVDDRAPDLAGSIVFEHDIVAPLDEAWDAES